MLTATILNDSDVLPPQHRASYRDDKLFVYRGDVLVWKHRTGSMDLKQARAMLRAVWLDFLRYDDTFKQRKDFLHSHQGYLIIKHGGGVEGEDYSIHNTVYIRVTGKEVVRALVRLTTKRLEMWF